MAVQKILMIRHLHHGLSLSLSLWLPFDISTCSVDGTVTDDVWWLWLVKRSIPSGKLT